MKEKIIPIPRYYEELEEGALQLAAAGRSFVKIINEAGDKVSEQLIADTLAALMKSGNDGAPCGTEVPVTLRYAQAPAEAAGCADQGYRLTCGRDGILIEGFGEAGLFYGAETLCQMLDVTGEGIFADAVRILDWPDMKTRGHFMECRFGTNNMSLQDWKELVDHMASMKMNRLAVALYGCWDVQYDGRVSEYLFVPIRKYPKLKTPVVYRYFDPETGSYKDEEHLPPMFEQDFFGDLIAYGKTKHVEIFPLWNSYGHNTLIPAQYPEVSAKDENGEPSLTGFCTANPQTYELLFDCYDEIIDRYLAPNGIRSFHVGMDEVWDGLAQNAEDIFRVRSPWCKCPVCAAKSRRQLYLDHAVRVLKHLKEKGIENIYMYQDMLTNYSGAAGEGESTGDLLEALEQNGLKENVVVDWWSYADYKENLTYETTLPEQGLRRTVKPWNGYTHWNSVFHPIRNAYLLGDIAFREAAEGMLSYSSWDRSFDRVHVCQANYAWNFAETGSPQKASDLYVSARFPGKYAEVRRAFTLLDAVTGVNRTVNKKKNIITEYGGSDMIKIISYYFYSYVKKNKPYPRKFPGEAMTQLLANPWESRIRLAGMAAMAREAKDLFAEAAGDEGCDRELALRYAWEAAHSECMAEDFLALLDMNDLYQDDRTAHLEEIRTLAEEAAEAREKLMRGLKDVKEPYLWPSHLRNHSVFYQFFRDLAAYLENTPAEEVQLDFTDLSSFCGEKFWKLR